MCCPPEFPRPPGCFLCFLEEHIPRQSTIKQHQEQTLHVQHQTQEQEEHSADSVIITTPLHIIHEITFVPPLPSEIQDVVGVYYAPCVKIRARDNSGRKRALLAVSKTDIISICELHYPIASNSEDERDRGTLMCYIHMGKTRPQICFPE